MAEWCGGTGWIEVGDTGEFRPCPRCNPYTSDIFADPAKTKRWHDGTQTNELLSTVAKTRDGMKGEVPMPTPCRADTRYAPDDIVAPNAGYDIALRSYEQDCRKQGIAVDYDRFHRVMGSLVDVMPKATEAKGPDLSDVRDPSAPSPAPDIHEAMSETARRIAGNDEF